jgi:hypothetical protein
MIRLVEYARLMLRRLANERRTFYTQLVDQWKSVWKKAYKACRGLRSYLQKNRRKEEIPRRAPCRFTSSCTKAAGQRRPSTGTALVSGDLTMSEKSADRRIACAQPCTRCSGDRLCRGRRTGRTAQECSWKGRWPACLWPTTTAFWVLHDMKANSTIPRHPYLST